MAWNPFAFLDGLAAASAKLLGRSVQQEGALETLLGVDREDDEPVDPSADGRVPDEGRDAD